MARVVRTLHKWTWVSTFVLCCKRDFWYAWILVVQLKSQNKLWHHNPICLFWGALPHFTVIQEKISYPPNTRQVSFFFLHAVWAVQFRFCIPNLMWATFVCGYKSNIEATRLYYEHIQPIRHQKSIMRSAGVACGGVLVRETTVKKHCFVEQCWFYIWLLFHPTWNMKHQVDVWL